ncbi:MAG: hypothetical protein NXH82_15640 [Rhodobacteraceae bacterium]|nr:hypothetical protein [Paracoccaceae bacterium]
MQLLLAEAHRHQGRQKRDVSDDAKDRLEPAPGSAPPATAIIDHTLDLREKLTLHFLPDPDASDVLRSNPRAAQRHIRIFRTSNKPYANLSGRWHFMKNQTARMW